MGTRLFLTIAFLPFLAVSATADDSARSDTDLIQDLADARYSVRAAATEALRRRGVLAAASLQAGARSTDLEVRRRCEWLLAVSPWQEHAQRLEAFLRNGDDSSPLPGWLAFKHFLGNDAHARSLYAMFFRSDFSLLEAIEMDQDVVGLNFHQRLQRNGEKMGTPRKLTAVDSTALLLHIQTAKLDPNMAWTVVYNLHHPQVQGTIANEGPQALMAEFIEKRFDPMFDQLVGEVEKRPLDSDGKFWQVTNLARQMHRSTLVDQRLRPAVVRALREAAKEPPDLKALVRGANIARGLGGLEEELAQILTPVLPSLTKELAANDQNFFSINSLIQVLGQPELANQYLRPYVRAQLDEVLRPPVDLRRLGQVQFKARYINMLEEIESQVRPAVLTSVATLVRRGADVDRLQEGLSLAMTVNLGPKLQPIARDFADSLDAKTDFDRLSICLAYLRAAQLPNLPEIVEQKLRPTARLALDRLKHLPINQHTIAQSLTTLQALEAREGGDLALRAAREQSLPASTRVQALQFLVLYGAPQHAAGLEDLFNDAANVGRFNSNNQDYGVQLGDLALACAIHLRGQKVRDYGFPYFRDHPAANFQETFPFSGFDSHEARQAAQQLWRNRGSAATP